MPRPKKKAPKKENWRGFIAKHDDPEGNGFPRPGIRRFRVYPLQKLRTSEGLKDVAIIELLPRAKPRKRP